jgi:fructose-bisphosphate aldolase class II
MEAAQETDSPVILQASAGARKYAGEAYLRHMMLAAVETHPDIPVVVHQDHGASPSVCIQSIRSGFTSVMMDGSLMEDAKTPASYDYNVAVTRQVCAMAQAIGVSVEGELGCLGSLETGDAGEEDGVGAEGKLTHDMMLTDPVQVRISAMAATDFNLIADSVSLRRRTAFHRDRGHRRGRPSDRADGSAGGYRCMGMEPALSTPAR